MLGSAALFGMTTNLSLTLINYATSPATSDTLCQCSQWMDAWRQEIHESMDIHGLDWIELIKFSDPIIWIGLDCQFFKIQIQ